MAWNEVSAKEDPSLSFQPYYVAMIRQKLVGSVKLPPNNKAAQKECDRILKIIWNTEAAEKLIVRELLPVIQRAIDAERAAGVAPPVG